MWQFYKQKNASTFSQLAQRADGHDDLSSVLLGCFEPGSIQNGLGGSPGCPKASRTNDLLIIENKDLALVLSTAAYYY